MSDSKAMRSAAVAGGAAAAVLGALMAKYPDRAIFSKRMDESIPFIGGAPLFGSLFRQLANVDTAYDLMLSDFERLDVLTTQVLSHTAQFSSGLHATFSYKTYIVQPRHLASRPLSTLSTREMWSIS